MMSGQSELDKRKERSILFKFDANCLGAWCKVTYISIVVMIRPL